MGDQKKHRKDPEDWNMKRQRDGDKHIKNCGTGYRFKGQSQIHHIVCVTCMQDATIVKKAKKKNMEFIRSCLKETTWNINDEPNTIGLPLTPVYYQRPNDMSWDNLPCHQVDHNPQYRDAVSNYLYEVIWSTLIRDRKKCVFDPQALAEQLDNASKEYRRFLNKRGKQMDGTRRCWNNRPDLTDAKGKPRGEQLKRWYVPFSMDPGTPRARKAPPEDEPPSLKKLFKLL
jgi:hypothetical protein